MRSPVLVAIAIGASAASCACRRSPSAPPASAHAATPLPGAPGATTRVPREYLVTVAAGSGEAAVREVYGRYGIARIQGLGGGVFLVTLSEDPGPEKMEELRRQDPRIRAVQPNFTYKAS